MVSFILFTVYLFLGGKLPNFFVGASAVGAPSHGIKWRSDYEAGTTKWHFAADESAVDFISRINSAPLYSNGIYHGHDGLLDNNSTHVKIVDGLLHSIDEHGPKSELVLAVNQHLSPTTGLDFDITAPQIIAGAAGVVVLAGLLCVFIPGCLVFVASNMGNAVTAFRVASGGAVIGDAAGVITALSTAVASVGARSGLEFDTSRSGFIGVGGYYMSTELYDHMHARIAKRDDFEDESFSCIYNDGWVGTCHNQNVLRTVLDGLTRHDNDEQDRWSCWETRGSDGTVFGWYYHCVAANEECGLPCANGAPIPPYTCATVNDKGGRAWSTAC
ncbi:hypothetical protein PT974_04488 [Cladobotryum mycophilum]|uniref:Uncharacterized protein n=1 Tax=Cladobotryum mycophilum TaxID=491253 RepID=A0ABR0SWA4_9HYPO